MDTKQKEPGGGQKIAPSLQEMVALLKVMSRNDENKVNPVGIQCPLLGLDQATLKGLRGKRVLDVACGDGSLVRHLRLNGIDAEGIDARAPDGFSYLMKRNITGTKAMGKGIPRPDGHYDLIVSFQNVLLNSVFSNIGGDANTAIAEIGDQDTKEQHLSYCIAAQCMVFEINRSTAPGGKAVLFPHLPRLREVMDLSLGSSNLAIGEERIQMEDLKAFAEWEAPEVHFPDGTLDKACFVTVLRR
jgi:SAM-dependent methyltransferase